MKLLALLTLWESATPVYLAIYGCCSQWFLCHHSYACACLDHELRTMWAWFCACPQVIKSCLPHVYLVSTLHITHVIECTRLSAFLAGRAWERGYTRLEYSLGYRAMCWVKCHRPCSHSTCQVTIMCRDNINFNTLHLLMLNHNAVW